MRSHSVYMYDTGEIKILLKHLQAIKIGYIHTPDQISRKLLNIKNIKTVFIQARKLCACPIGVIYKTHLKLVFMDISITTRGSILRKVKRLNFESLNDTERRCFSQNIKGYGSLWSLSCKMICVNQLILL